MSVITGVLDALSNGAGIVLLLTLALFITALLTEQVHQIRTSIQKENHRHDPHA